MEYDKVIFLDIDGPLATSECYRLTELRHNRQIYKWNPACVKILNEVIEETGAVIVLSSDWRRFFNEEELKDIFDWNEVIASPVAVTDQDKYKMSSGNELDRIHQIKRFLENNSIKNWVAVDDMDLKSDIVPNFVQVEEETGLTGEGIKDKLKQFLTLN